MRSASLLVVALLLSACGSTQSTTFTNVAAQSTPTPRGPACEPAPAWLVAGVQDGITQPGATLGNVSIMPAGEVLAGPPIATGPKFASATLIVGTISGGGVDNESAVWITDRIDQADPGLLFAVSAAAKRYSDWGADVKDDILVENFTAAFACLGGTL